MLVGETRDYFVSCHLYCRLQYYDGVKFYLILLFATVSVSLLKGKKVKNVYIYGQGALSYYSTRKIKLKF